MSYEEVLNDLQKLQRHIFDGCMMAQEMEEDFTAVNKHRYSYYVGIVRNNLHQAQREINSCIDGVKEIINEQNGNV